MQIWVFLRGVSCGSWLRDWFHLSVRVASQSGYGAGFHRVQSWVLRWVCSGREYGLLACERISSPSTGQLVGLMGIIYLYLV